MARTELRGRLVLDEGVAVGRIVVEDEWIAEVDLDVEPAEDGLSDSDDLEPTAASTAGDDDALPWLAPGFVDVHVHGWGGFDAMGDHGTSTGWRGPCSARASRRSSPRAGRPRCRSSRRSPSASASGCRTRRPMAPSRSGSTSRARSSRRRGRALTTRSSSRRRRTCRGRRSSRSSTASRLTTIAPEIPGALELIRRLRKLGVCVAIGHSAADLEQALAGYDAGGTTTTHLFNAMTGIEHRSPGLAVAALTRDDAFVELIADGHHVDPALWPIVQRTKPVDRLILVSDALAMAGTGDGRVTVGGMEIDVDRWALHDPAARRRSPDR